MADSSSTPHPLLRPSDVAQMLGVTERTLGLWRTRGIYLPYVRVTGNRVRYAPEDVSAFVAARRCSVGSARAQAPAA